MEQSHVGRNTFGKVICVCRLVRVGVVLHPDFYLPVCFDWSLGSRLGRLDMTDCREAINVVVYVPWPVMWHFMRHRVSENEPAGSRSRAFSRAIHVIATRCQLRPC